VIVEALVDLARDDGDARVLGHEVRDALRSRDQVEEDDVLLEYTVLEQNLDRHGHRATCRSEAQPCNRVYDMSKRKSGTPTEYEPVASMGSSNSTRRCAMSFGSLAYMNSAVVSARRWMRILPMRIFWQTCASHTFVSQARTRETNERTR